MFSFLICVYLLCFGSSECMRHDQHAMTSCIDKIEKVLANCDNLIQGQKEKKKSLYRNASAVVLPTEKISSYEQALHDFIDIAFDEYVERNDAYIINYCKLHERSSQEYGAVKCDSGVFSRIFNCLDKALDDKYKSKMYEKVFMYRLGQRNNKDMMWSSVYIYYTKDAHLNNTMYGNKLKDLSARLYEEPLCDKLVLNTLCFQSMTYAPNIFACLEKNFEPMLDTFYNNNYKLFFDFCLYLKYGVVLQSEDQYNYLEKITDSSPINREWYLISPSCELFMFLSCSGAERYYSYYGNSGKEAVTSDLTESYIRDIFVKEYTDRQKALRTVKNKLLFYKDKDVHSERITSLQDFLN